MKRFHRRLLLRLLIWLAVVHINLLDRLVWRSRLAIWSLNLRRYYYHSVIITSHVVKFLSL